MPRRDHARCAASQGEPALWAGHLRAGAALAAGTALLVAAYVVLGDRPAAALLVPTALAVAALSPLLVRLPRSRAGQVALYGWCSALCVVLGVAAALDGGSASPLLAVLPLVLAFSSLTCPPLGLVVLSAVVPLTGLAVLVVAGPVTPAATLLVVLLLAQSAVGLACRESQWSSLHRQLELTRRLEGMAREDQLTGLLNRREVDERLAAALAADAPAGRCTGVVVLDLDGFKDVNDSLGHAAGDAVLQEVAARLRAVVREGDVVARLGGDEFLVGLPGLASPADAERVAAALRGALGAPYATSAGAVVLGGSVGVAVAPQDGCDEVDLLKRADLAMYRAKRGHAGWARYDVAADADPRGRLELLADLRAAIDGGGLRLAYQPVVLLGTGEVSSVEALLRWDHPRLGPQSPADFVALAESAGLVGALTDAVVTMAAAQAAAWDRAGRALPVAVNVSSSDLARPGFAAHLLGLATAQGCDPRLLRVEVTETSLVEERAVAVLRELAAAGLRVGVDDFGTGYSSLGRLKQLPVQALKIDRSFVTGLHEDRRDVAIVRAVVALADELGLNVIAEGVETADVARTLHRLGVPKAQGYLFSRPLPAHELEAALDAGRVGAPAEPSGAAEPDGAAARAGAAAG
ncbi:putative bifunctional diguanylate cyclase/phosphodiesterase [Vallicoccus soli]|uniref:EAL domain-containing protein n=1 Tax=Vallicoccus soli TaxID=2339232 RepID=A0A3A3Z3M4_9ACTN|nr:EAL domain-containing protein [Vallicoccus soli]RJK97498.1 EAL domain-containing protein [Vallicoccus soli]